MENRIKEARKSAGITQEEMSKLFGIPKRTIGNWETGERKPAKYVEDLIVEKIENMKSEEENMTIMKDDLILRKEGKYWTLYLGDYSLSCGDLEDMTESIEKVGKRLENGEAAEDIIKEFNNFR